MLYCENCRIAFEDGTRCPGCGSRKVRTPEPGDICLLTEVLPIPGGMLEDVLRQEGIPVLSSSSIGAGLAMRAGAMFERVRLYVRYEHLDQAAAIAEELFQPDENTPK